MSERDRGVTSDRAPSAVGAYPHARRAGGLLFLSGIGPRRPGDGSIPGATFGPDGELSDYDIEPQCRSVFDNVRIILEDAGSSWDRIVDVTVFLTDIRRDFSRFNQLYAEAFGEVRPTRTTVEVNRLPTPIAIELKVIAAID